MNALLFIPVALGFKKLLTSHGLSDQGATLIAIASAIAQATGLLRWVLVVPGLAATYKSTNTTPATRDAVLVIFDVIHHYGGMVLGEMVGQLLLMGWTASIGFSLFRHRVLPRWLAVFGLATVPFWVLGQTELLHGVIPAIPSIEVVPLAFMAWEAWLAAIAVVLIFETRKTWPNIAKPRPLRSQAAG